MSSQTRSEFVRSGRSYRNARIYYYYVLFRLKIIVILRLDMQTNAWCEITKIPLVFYEKDLDNILSLL